VGLESGTKVLINQSVNSVLSPLCYLRFLGGSAFASFDLLLLGFIIISWVSAIIVLCLSAPPLASLFMHVERFTATALKSHTCDVLT
jgi:hypothetical protein